MLQPLTRESSLNSSQGPIIICVQEIIILLTGHRRGPLLLDSRRTRCTIIWAASSKFGIYRLCEQRKFRRACASAQSRQNLRGSLIQAVRRGTFRQKARSLAPLNGWACAVKICQDRMLEDTYSLDAVHLIVFVCPFLQ